MRRILLGMTLVFSSASVAGAESAQAHRDYVLHCSGCHGMSGMGAPEGGIPPFPDSVGRIASSDIGRTYIMHVPGVVANSLTDERVADVMNFVLDRWGDGEQPFSTEEVTHRRAMPIGDVVIYRRKVVEELGATGVEIADYPWP